VDVPKPRVVEDRDVILKVTGSTVCGSDLHLLHEAVVQMEKGDILGHEFCGVVESMGNAVTDLKAGDRVVASFQIACGDVNIPVPDLQYVADFESATIASRSFLLSVSERIVIPWRMACSRFIVTLAPERTNYHSGGNTAGMFGYSHFTGGFAGGQAEYVRVRRYFPSEAFPIQHLNLSYYTRK
jgi:threonine dehydrogenase-like Zn-dependent dehydrogenase